MMKTLCLLLAAVAATLIATPSYAQETRIENFIVKEDLFKNDRLAVIAADSNETAVENINGSYEFSVNGFKEELGFVNSTATISRQIDKSAFVYIKHQNEFGSNAKLYYVLKRDTGLSPFKINWMVLLIIPALLVVLGMLFRKFIIIAVVLLGLLFFFNYSNGLDISTFFEAIFNGIRSLF